MRVIKFRAWLKNENRYISVNRIDFADGTLKSSIFGNEFYDFNDLVLEQFAGLHDKNVVEIYDGDKVIIEKEDDEEIFIVKWDNNTARFIMESETYILDFDNYNEKDFEVIGNIHEENENNDK